MMLLRLWLLLRRRGVGKGVLCLLLLLRLLRRRGADVRMLWPGLSQQARAEDHRAERQQRSRRRSEGVEVYWGDGPDTDLSGNGREHFQHPNVETVSSGGGDAHDKAVASCGLLRQGRKRERRKGREALTQFCENFCEGRDGGRGRKVVDVVVVCLPYPSPACA